MQGYYKPKDAFVCCYLSPTYGELYSDGYGLNFYYHEYGYYEYCNDQKHHEGEDSGSSGKAIGISLTVVFAIVAGIYCYCKRDDGKDKEEEEPQPTQKIVYNITT